MRLHTLAGLALLAAPASAQQPLEFSAGVEAVSLDVFVSRDGEPVTDLTAANFEVRDDGVRQEVEVVLREEAPPLHVVLVLDTSASVAGLRLADLKSAAADFLSRLGAGDLVTLATFSYRSRLEGPIGADPRTLSGALLSKQAGGGTALVDAVYSGLQLADARLGRPVVVVFSDGEDGLSWLSAEQVERAARESEAVVFAIHSRQAPIPVDGRPTGWARLRDPSTRFLRRVTGDSGGQLWDASAGGLGDAFRKVLAEFQSRYLLRYRPRSDCGDWHELEVKLRGRKGVVRSRRGYSVSCQSS